MTHVGLSIVSSLNWTMDEEGSRRISTAGLEDNCQITATVAIAMTAEALPVQILYTGTIERCQPFYLFPPVSIYSTHPITE